MVMNREVEDIKPKYDAIEITLSKYIHTKIQNVTNDGAEIDLPLYKEGSNITRIYIKKVKGGWEGVIIKKDSRTLDKNSVTSLMDGESYENLLSSWIMRKAYKFGEFSILPWEMESQKDNLRNYILRISQNGEKSKWIDLHLFNPEDGITIKVSNMGKSDEGRIGIFFKTKNSTTKQSNDIHIDTVIKKLYEDIFYKNPFTNRPWENQILENTVEKTRDGVKTTLTKEKDSSEIPDLMAVLALLQGWKLDNNLSKLAGKKTGEFLKSFLDGLSIEFNGKDIGEKIAEIFTEIGKGMGDVIESISDEKGKKDIEKLILTGQEKYKTPLILSEQVREDIEEFIYLVNTSSESGIPLPKGYILQGPPGCGKTSLMKYIATSVNPDKVIVFRIEPSFYRSFLLSVGEKGIGKLLESIKKYAQSQGKHAIIFMDEFEDIARTRSQTHEAYAKELNVLLRFLDGLEDTKDITFIGATNANINELDSAILRGGRCSQIIRLDKPEKDGKEKFITDFFSSNENKGFLGVFNIIMFAELIQDNYNFGDIEEVLNICLRKLSFRRDKSKNGNLKLAKEDITKAIVSFKSQRGQLSQKAG